MELEGPAVCSNVRNHANIIRRVGWVWSILMRLS